MYVFFIMLLTTVQLILKKREEKIKLLVGLEPAVAGF